MGDSKTSNGEWIGDLLYTVNVAGERVLWETPYRFATSGWTLAALKAAVDSRIAECNSTPDAVLINIGVNDFNGTVPDQATWEGDLAYVLDAVNTKWPSAQVYIMRIWKRGASQQAGLTAIDDTYIPNVIATRAWAHLGPDERVFLENGDDGATYTTDGIHPNAAGYQLEADAWQTLLGY